VLGSQKVNEIRIGYNRVQDDLYPFVTDTTPAEFGFKGVPVQRGVTGLPRVDVDGFASIGEALFLPNFKISEVTQVRAPAPTIFRSAGIRTRPCQAQEPSSRGGPIPISAR
jgi:hypothetical protein